MEHKKFTDDGAIVTIGTGEAANGAIVTSNGNGEAEAGNMQAADSDGNKVYSTALVGTQNGVQRVGGRFLPGNPGGPGRKKRADEQAILTSLSKVLDPPTVLAEALQLARSHNSWRGILACVELALAYQIGRPTQRVEHSDAASPAEWLEALLSDAA